MKRITWLLISASALALTAPPVLAANSGKCPLSTQECLDMMARKLKTKGWLGVEITDEAGQLKITKVSSGGPAEMSGLAAGDILFAMNGVEYTPANAETLAALREDMTAGKTFTFTILKGGKEKEDVQLTLSPTPPDIMAQMIGRHLLREHLSAAEAGK